MYIMKIENHEKKIKRLENTLSKLDFEEDSETIIEDCMLIASHLINSAMHKLGTLKQDKDIKHNQISGFLKRERLLKEESDETASLIQEIEQLRPSYVYGTGESTDAAIKSKESLDKIKEICSKILKNERKSKDSN